MGNVGSIAQPGGVWVRAVVLNWGGFYPLCLVDRAQGFCSTSDNVAHNRELSGPNVYSAEVATPCAGGQTAW